MHVRPADEDYNVVGLTWQGQANQPFLNTVPLLYTIYDSNRYSAGVLNYTLPVPSAGSYQLRIMFLRYTGRRPTRVCSMWRCRVW